MTSLNSAAAYRWKEHPQAVAQTFCEPKKARRPLEIRYLDVPYAINSALEAFRAKQTLAGIQDPALSASFRMTLLIAEFLVAEDGKIQIALIPKVIKYVKDSAFQEEGPKPYFMARIETMLSLLLANDTLLMILQGIAAPQNSDSLERCKLMINATLMKARSHSPTDRDAVVIGLKHLLDDARELGTNTSLIEGVQIAINTLMPEQSIKDAADLITKGACFRKCLNETLNKYEQVGNTFATYIACSELNKTISVNALGDIQNENASIDQTIKIYDAPPIKAALLQMGIPSNCPTLNAAVIQKLSAGQSLFTTDSEKILYAYASEWIQQHPQEKRSQLMELGCYGFAALCNSPSQREMVSIIASMPQHFGERYPACWIVECITKTFAEQMKKLSDSKKSGLFTGLTSWWSASNKDKIDNGSVEEKVNQTVKEVLGKITSVQFEQIQTLDHKGPCGTYRLYQKNLESSLEDYGNIGLRITTGAEFQQYVQTALLESQQMIESWPDYPEPAKKACTLLLNEMSAYCSGKTFIPDTLLVYNNQLGLKAPFWPPLAKAQKTPWNSGFFPSAEIIANTWIGSAPKPDQVIRLSYEEINQLIPWVFNDVIGIDTLQVGRGNPRMYQGYADSELFALGFNWLTEHPTIIKLKEVMDQDNASLDETLHSLLAVPGLQVANTPINLSSFIKFLQHNIFQLAKLDEAGPFSALLNSENEETKKEMAAFSASLVGTIKEKSIDFVDSLTQKDLTIHSVSNELVRFLNRAFNPKNKQAISNAIEGIVTIATVRSLSKDNFSKIVDNAIHVADSNFESIVGLWPRNAQIGFYFNPVTESYGLAMITEGNDPFFYPLTRSLKNVEAVLRDLLGADALSY